MIVLGIICLVAGYLIPMPVLMTVGWILLAIGIVLLLVGTVGHREIGGRRYWY